MIRLLSYNLKTTLLLFSYSSNKAQPQPFQLYGSANIPAIWHSPQLPLQPQIFANTSQQLTIVYYLPQPQSLQPQYNMDNSSQDFKSKAFKVIIVGPQAVGKSSILVRLSDSQFTTAYLSTVGIDFKTYTSHLQGKPYSLQIWDTAGQQKFRALTTTYFKGSQGCVCVFDLSDDGTTLQKCGYYLAKAAQQNIPKECIFLVGNKSDAKGQPNQAGNAVAQKHKIQYRECSAKEGTGVAQIFDNLAANLVGRYGSVASEESSALKPQISIKEGRRGCC